MYKTDINKINLSSTDFIETDQFNDLTIGEDDSNVLTIASKLNIPRGDTGQVLTKQSDGLVKFADTNKK